MQIEKFLSYTIAKPLAWLLYALWLAVKFSWRCIVWCARKTRERCSKLWTRARATARTKLPLSTHLKDSTKRIPTAN